MEEWKKEVSLDQEKEGRDCSVSPHTFPPLSSLSLSLFFVQLLLLNN